MNKQHQELVGREFLFQGMKCWVTAVHTTHLNFIGRRIYTSTSFGRGYDMGAKIEDFVKDASPWNSGR
jgi:hypothetical protein